MKNRAKPLKRTIFWGVITLAVFFLIFLNQETITQYFMRGGFSAAGVAAAALLFYFLASAFADALGETIGLRAGNKLEGRSRQNG
ncbi:MAG: hypothetical protein K6U04_15040 [Armatimonadetes bacterium]|nr:hypothetical protein [Armatimonadota bacterium]